MAIPPIPRPATSAVMSTPMLSTQSSKAIDQIADLAKNLINEIAFFTALFLPVDFSLLLLDIR